MQYLSVAFVVGVSLFIRFTNPEMTETQLFVNFWYWWLVLLVVGYLIFPKRHYGK